MTQLTHAFPWLSYMYHRQGVTSVAPSTEHARSSARSARRTHASGAMRYAYCTLRSYPNMCHARQAVLNQPASRILAKHIPAIHLVRDILKVVSDAVGDDDVRQFLD